MYVMYVHMKIRGNNMYAHATHHMCMSMQQYVYCVHVYMKIHGNGVYAHVIHDLFIYTICMHVCMYV